LSNSTMLPEAPSFEWRTVADTFAGAVTFAMSEELEIFSVWKKFALSASGNDILVPEAFTTGDELSGTGLLAALFLQPAINVMARQVQTSMFFMIIARFD